MEKIFLPIKIGSMQLSERILMPPMATYFADKSGFVTERLLAYYLERAAGGAKCITIEHAGVREDGKANPRMLMVSKDMHMEGLKNLVDKIHSKGSKIIFQINHAGRQTSSKNTGHIVVGVSDIACPIAREKPKKLNIDQIDEIIKAFCDASRRIKEVGADGIELHMGHGYLLNQFLSPAVNNRTDQFGGSNEKRMIVPLRILKLVKEIVGMEFPIICRISADEYMENGLNILDSKKIAQNLEANGADAIHVSACQHCSNFPIIPHYYLKEGVYVHLAKSIKEVVKIPVIGVGRIRTLELAKKIINNGNADIVSIGRALIADPQFLNKARDGHFKDIVPCISCNRCSLSLVKDGELCCSVNPRVGKEYKYKVIKKEKKIKKIIVIGGGPAGMKAAQICSLRGFKVDLYEKEIFLGGRFRLAATPPKKEVLNRFTEYLITQMDQLKVNLHLGKEFSTEMIKISKPDAIIIATGAKTIVPSFCNKIDIITDENVLRGTKTGKRVLVIGGGGIGSEVADFLAERGKKVTLLEMRSEIAEDLQPIIKKFLNKRLKEKKVKIVTSAKALMFDNDCLIYNGPNGEARFNDFDSIVVSLGSKSNNYLFDDLNKYKIYLAVVGDAKEPRDLISAIAEAEEAALKI